MAKPATRERVAMTHPHGKPTVLVSPARAVALRERGYTSAAAGTITTADGEQPAKLDRKALGVRAKGLGVPVKGTNEELLAAITAAEPG